MFALVRSNSSTSDLGGELGGEVVGEVGGEVGSEWDCVRGMIGG